METITARQLLGSIEDFCGQELVLKGWIRTNRDQKAFGFISFNDGSHFSSLQVVYDREILDNYDEVSRYRAGAAIRVAGIVKATPGAKQPLEIQACQINLEGDCPEDYPLQPKRHSREFLREVAHLRPRTNLFSAVFRIRSLLSYGVHRFFQERGFLHVHTPIITASDAEGAGETFRVSVLEPPKAPLNDAGELDYSRDFFACPANLTVSGQLEAEAFALAFQKVYTFGPTFRAENSNTARHAAEFWMIEPEMAFAGLEEDMGTAEEMMKYLISLVLEEAQEEMEFLDHYVEKGLRARLQGILASSFARLTYTRAIELLQDAKADFVFAPEWGRDLQTEHERFLTEKILGKPVFVTDYPRDIKAFYMRQNDDGRTVAAMDLLVPGVGEIIGGSQREERLEMLASRMAEMGIGEESLWWYLDLRRYGGVPHAGFGLGFERMLMYVTGISNIRDAIPFPRTVRSCQF